MIPQLSLKVSHFTMCHSDTNRRQPIHTACIGDAQTETAYATDAPLLTE